MSSKPFDPNAAASSDAGVFGLPHSQEEAHVVLLPVPYEATCSYGGGTSLGAEAILEASKQVDLFDAETGRPYERGIHMLPVSEDIRAWNASAKTLAQGVIEAGGNVEGNASLAADLRRVNDYCANMNAAVEREAERLLGLGKLVGVVGGDHSTPFGSIRAHARRHPDMGILHVDAHADLRDAFEGFTWSHASIFHNVMTRIPEVSTLVQVGIRDFCEAEFEMARQSKGRIHLNTDAAAQALMDEGQSWATLVNRMLEPLPREVYVSVDIDGLDPSLCPNTGTPVPGGLSFAQFGTLLRLLVKSGRRVVGFDLTEVSPAADNDWDANVGARVLYKLIGWSLRSRH